MERSILLILIGAAILVSTLVAKLWPRWVAAVWIAAGLLLMWQLWTGEWLGAIWDVLIYGTVVGGCAIGLFIAKRRPKQ